MTPHDGTDDIVRRRVNTELRQLSIAGVETDVFDAGIVPWIAVEEGAVYVAIDLSDHEDIPSEEVMTAVLREIGTLPGVERTHVEQVTDVTGGQEPNDDA